MKSNAHSPQIIVISAGIAGLTAAHFLAKAGMSVKVLEASIRRMCSYNPLHALTSGLLDMSALVKLGWHSWQLRQSLSSLTLNDYSRRIYRWKQAEPYSPVGRATDLLYYRNGRSMDRQVLLAGDHMRMPFTEGAAESGKWAAEQICNAASNSVVKRDAPKAAPLTIMFHSCPIICREEMSMTPDIAIKLGGLFNLAFVIFHALFWRIFGWKHDLRSLSFNNRQIMQVLNLCLMFSFLIFAYISFFHTGELTGTALGHALLLLISVFWLLRAMEQAVFFRLKRSLSVAFFVLFLIGSVLYAYPWLAVRGL